MKINQGSGKTDMSEAFLYIQYVFTHLQKMRGTGMAERMNRERMVETCLHKCILKDSSFLTVVRISNKQFNAGTKGLGYEEIKKVLLTLDENMFIIK